MKRAPSSRSRLAMATAFVVGLVAVVLTGGCGVPSEGGFEAFDDEDFGFDQPTSTTSTTVATEPTTPTSVVDTSTTIATEPVTLYFLAGNQLSGVSIALARPASPAQVVAALVEGPPDGPVGAGLRTALPPLVPEVTPTRGGVLVHIPPGFFAGIPPADQRLAVAQLVLTLTERGGVGTVEFVDQDGVPIAVPKGSGVSSQPGEALYHDDYDSLLTTELPPDDVLQQQSTVPGGEEPT